MSRCSCVVTSVDSIANLLCVVVGVLWGAENEEPAPGTFQTCPAVAEYGRLNFASQSRVCNVSLLRPGHVIGNCNRKVVELVFNCTHRRNHLRLGAVRGLVVVSIPRPVVPNAGRGVTTSAPLWGGRYSSVISASLIRCLASSSIGESFAPAKSPAVQRGCRPFGQMLSSGRGRVPCQR